MNETNLIDEQHLIPVSVDTTDIVDTTTDLGLKQLIIDKYINELTDDELVDKYSLSRSTIYRRLGNERSIEIRFNMTPQFFKRKMSSQWHDMFDKAVPVVQEKLDNILDPSKPDKASLAELGTLLGIATDKMQLLTGQATERVEYADMGQSLEELRAQKEQLRKELGFDPDDQEQVIDADIVSDSSECEGGHK